MVATAVACGGAHVGMIPCGLLQQQRTGHAAGFEVRPVRMPLPYCSRERQGVPALLSTPDLQPSREMRAVRLRAGAESEHLGVLNVPKQTAEHSGTATQINSLPQSAPPTPESASSPEDHTIPSSPKHRQHQEEVAQQQNEERIADGARAGPSGQEQHVRMHSDEQPDSSHRNQSPSDEPSNATGSNRAPSDRVGPDQEVSDGPSDGDEEGEPMYGSRTLRDVCDKLIAVFTVEKPEVADWKRLLALSSEWANIRPKFYTHIKRRAKEAEEEGNPEYALQLYSLQRRLNKVEDEMAMHDKLLAEVEAETDWNSMVVRRREEFTQDFFQHIRIRADSQFNELGRRDELVNLSAKLVTAIQVHDNIQKDEALMLKAEEKFLGLLDSPDLTTLDSKIDQLAQTGGLDPALLLTMSKAYCAAKDTNLVRDEVKDIMAHMYFKAQQSQQMYLPKEVRILRYLITIDDPQERYRALEQAFEPGDESDPFEDAESAMLYTTPEALYDVVSSVLKAYFTGAKASTMVKEAAALMRPKVIDRIKLLKDMIQKDFL